MEAYRPTKAELLSEMRRVKRKQRWGHLARWLVVLLALGAAAGWFCFSRYYTLAVMKSGDMGPTLPSGSVALCRRMEQTEISRGDLILIRRDGGLSFRRAVALAGDRVVVNYAGEVRLNGQVLEEDYVTGKGLDAGIIARRLTVPEGEIFALGDQRSLALDSRYADYGTVPLEQAVGKVEWIIWPLSRLGKP